MKFHFHFLSSIIDKNSLTIHNQRRLIGIRYLVHPLILFNKQFALPILIDLLAEILENLNYIITFPSRLAIYWFIKGDLLNCHFSLSHQNFF